MPASQSAAPASPARLFSRLTRKQAVWLSLLASMTVTGGALVAVDGKPAPRSDGIALAAPVRTAEAPLVETVFTTRKPLARAQWKRIVIHHSGARHGSPEGIAASHEARNLRGLGHHFVIGNGTGSGDGEVYLGHRWLDQQPGAHALGPDAEWHNLHSISICLVGDGNRRPFTEAQMRRLGDLVSSLCREFGIAEKDVLLHSRIAPGLSVADPGRFFDEAGLRRRLASLTIASGPAVEPSSGRPAR